MHPPSAGKLGAIKKGGRAGPAFADGHRGLGLKSEKAAVRFNRVDELTDGLPPVSSDAIKKKAPQLREEMWGK